MATESYSAQVDVGRAEATAKGRLSPKPSEKAPPRPSDMPGTPTGEPPQGLVRRRRRRGRRSAAARQLQRLRAHAPGGPALALAVPQAGHLLAPQMPSLTPFSPCHPLLLQPRAAAAPTSASAPTRATGCTWSWTRTTRRRAARARPAPSAPWAPPAAGERWFVRAGVLAAAAALRQRRQIAGASVSAPELQHQAGCTHQPPPAAPPHPLPARPLAAGPATPRSGGAC